MRKGTVILATLALLAGVLAAPAVVVVAQVKAAVAAPATVAPQPVVMASEAPADGAGAVFVAPPSPAEWATFWTSLGGWKGAGALGLTAVIVQGLLLLARSSFDPLPGATKLLVVTGLTLVSGALVLKQTGLDWASVLMHASTLSAAQVFVHQVVSEVKALMAPKPVAVVAALAPAPTETKSAS